MRLITFIASVAFLAWMTVTAKSECLTLPQMQPSLGKSLDKATRIYPKDQPGAVYVWQFVDKTAAVVIFEPNGCMLVIVVAPAKTAAELVQMLGDGI